MTTTPVPDITNATALVDRFFAARRSLKDSPHTTAAYRRDLAAILAHIADGTGVDQVSVDQLSAPVLRDAFGVFATTHAEGVHHPVLVDVEPVPDLPGRRGDPGREPDGRRAAAPADQSRPKPLQGEDTPETLLRSAALPRPNARQPWPERDLAVLATLLLTGLPSWCWRSCMER